MLFLHHSDGPVNIRTVKREKRKVLPVMADVYNCALTVSLKNILISLFNGLPLLASGSDLL